MPAVGSLTSDEVQARVEEISRILRERGVAADCPRCGTNDWQTDLLGYLVSPLRSAKDVVSFQVPPLHAPMLSLTCKNCGSTQLHNLNVLGVKR